MTQAARGSGQRREQQQSDKQQSSKRESGEVRKSQTFYEPLPIGSDAFMAPLAPPREPRSVELRRIALWCVLGSTTGAAAGALVLAFALNDEAPAATALGHVERAASAEVKVEKPSAPRPAATPEATETAEPAAAQTAPPGDEAAKVAEVPQAASASAESEPAAETKSDGDSGSRQARRSEPSIDKPSRAQVLAAMNRVQPAVRACFKGGHGVVTADMTILGRTGRVTTAQVSGQAGPVGSCVARAVRKAKFPKFNAESISIRYPMQH